MDSRAPYDKTTVVWSPDGELVQLGYARRASEKGMSAMGMVLNGEFLLLAGRIRKDELVVSKEKIRIIDDNLYMVASGLSSDSNYLLQQSRVISQRHTLIYGEPIGPEAIAKQIGDMMARHTMTGGLRAFGASLLVAGFHPHTHEPKLFYIDNGGSYFEVKAYASGQDSDKIISNFKTNYKQPIEDGKAFVLKTLNSIYPESTDKLTEDDVEIMIFKYEEKLL